MPRYVPLSVLLPKASRASRYRWRRDGKLRKPDLVINGRELYDEEKPLTSPASQDDDQNAK
jgi:hypothetical protein